MVSLLGPFVFMFLTCVCQLLFQNGFLESLIEVIAKLLGDSVMHIYAPAVELTRLVIGIHFLFTQVIVSNRILPQNCKLSICSETPQREFVNFFYPEDLPFPNSSDILSASTSARLNAF